MVQADTKAAAESAKNNAFRKLCINSPDAANNYPLSRPESRISMQAPAAGKTRRFAGSGGSDAADERGQITEHRRPLFASGRAFG